MNIAFFDFDGTITNTDTLFRFIRFSKGSFRFVAGLLMTSPVFLFYKLRLIPNWRAKEMVLSWFFRGNSEQELLDAGNSFASRVIPEIIRPEAHDAFDFHRRQGDPVVVVTASLSFWIKPWCDARGFSLIATEPEFANGTFTGRFRGKNCYGKEKVERIEKEFDLGSFEKIYAYGDSSGDREMLHLADVKYLKWTKIDKTAF